MIDSEIQTAIDDLKRAKVLYSRAASARHDARAALDRAEGERLAAGDHLERAKERLTFLVGLTDSAEEAI